MTTTQYLKMEVQVGDESAFSESVDTYSNLLPCLRVVPSYGSGRSTNRAIQNRLWNSFPGYLMPRGGTLEFDVYAAGPSVDTATGALPSTHWLYKLLKDGLGGGDATQVGGTVSGGATATSLPYAAATLVRGGIIRVGKKGDARADGQAAVIGATVSTPASLLTGLPVAPNSADVIRSGLLTYLTETPGTTKRCLLSWDGSDGQYAARGCQLRSAALKIVLGDVPVWTLTYAVAWWEPVSGIAFPSASLTQDDCKPRVSAGGSVFLQTLGTATRATENKAAEIELTLNLGLAQQMGQGGRDLQPTIGWVRVPASQDQPAAMLRLRLPVEDATKSTEYDSDGSDSVEKHCLIQLSAGDGTAKGEGRHFGLYLPRLYPMGARPGGPFTNYNGMRYHDVFYAAKEGPDTTNDLTKSAVRFVQS